MNEKARIIKEISEKLDDLHRSFGDELDFYDLNYEIEAINEINERYNLKGLYFYEDAECSDRILCLTEKEHIYAMGLNRKDTIKLLNAFGLKRLCENFYARDIYAPSTKSTYYSIDDLKHDLLAAKLGGLND